VVPTPRRGQLAVPAVQQASICERHSHRGLGPHSVRGPLPFQSRRGGHVALIQLPDIGEDHSYCEGNDRAGDGLIVLLDGRYCEKDCVEV